MKTFSTVMIGYCLAAILAMLALAVFAAPAAAQGMQHCAPRDAVVGRLAEKYGETRQAVGLGARNTVMEVFASGATGSWTITMTMATGVTCLVASGQNFEALSEALPPEGDPL